MIRQVLSIICYIIAGFFLVVIGVISFFITPSLGGKMAIMSLFLIPTLLLLTFGLALRRFRAWQHDIGVVLVSVSGYMIFLIITILAIFLTPEYRKLFANDVVNSFADYHSGAICVLTFGGLGILLLISSRQMSFPRKRESKK